MLFKKEGFYIPPPPFLVLLESTSSSLLSPSLLASLPSLIVLIVIILNHRHPSSSPSLFIKNLHPSINSANACSGGSPSSGCRLGNLQNSGRVGRQLRNYGETHRQGIIRKFGKLFPWKRNQNQNQDSYFNRLSSTYSIRLRPYSTN